MTAAPPARRFSGRAWRLFFALAGPWVAVLAAFGAVALAFPAGESGGAVLSADPGLSFGVGGPLAGTGGWRKVGGQWLRRPGTFGGLEWWEGGDSCGLFFGRIWLPASAITPGFAAAKPDRPADLIAAGVAIPWLLGVPAVWSALVLWRAVRREEGHVSPLASSARALRPWAVTLAAVGAALLVNGLAIPDRPVAPGGPRAAVLVGRVQRTPPGSYHPRLVRVGVERWPGGPAGVRGSGRYAVVGFWWLIAVPAVCNVCQAVADRRSRRATV